MNKNPAELFKRLVADAIQPPSVPTVYAVFVRNMYEYSGAPHLLYIGSSLKPQERRHSKNHPYIYCFSRFPDHLVYFKCFESDDYKGDEKILIKHYKPLLNKQHK